MLFQFSATYSGFLPFFPFYTTTYLIRTQFLLQEWANLQQPVPLGHFWGEIHRATIQPLLRCEVTVTLTLPLYVKKENIRSQTKLCKWEGQRQRGSRNGITIIPCQMHNVSIIFSLNCDSWVWAGRSNICHTSVMFLQIVGTEFLK